MGFFTQRPSYVKDIFDRINENGKAYIVGGYVRDRLLGNVQSSHDIDVEIYGLEAKKLEEILASFSNVIKVGKSFGVYKLDILPDFDFALARTEKKVGQSHTGFEITHDIHLTIEEASIRRDLTINSILFDPYTNEYIDPFGGIDDLNNHLLKAVSQQKFIEDPLRILRVARFLAKLPDFNVDPELENLCFNNRDSLKYLTKERVYREYESMLLSTMPSRSFEFLKRIDALPLFLKKMLMTPQRLDFHPEGNVFNHTMLVIDLAALNKDKVKKPNYFMWAALLHDIGKIKVTTKEGRAPNHDLVGEKMAYDEMIKISNNKSISKYVSIMVRTHMILMVAMKKQDFIPYLKVLRRIDGILELDDLILLSKCDKLGRKRIDIHTIGQFDQYIETMKSKYGISPITPIINGNSLKSLGYNDYSNYNSLLEYAYTLQLKGYSKEEILTKIKQKI